ncbi:MAG: hypothetical protein AAF517_12925, partial [Planctomycetota bacterium]
MRRVFAAVFALLLIPLSASGQYNPEGWIQFHGWNVLYPLVNPEGCSGGGEDALKGNWTAPYDLSADDAYPGDVWNIDFSQALSSGWGAPSLDPDPTWIRPSLETDTVDFALWGSLLNKEHGGSIPTANVLGIATTYVENVSEIPQALTLCVASDDSIAVFVNNKLVHVNSVCRGLSTECADEVLVALPAGQSRISVLVWQGAGGHSFRLRFRDERGNIVADGNNEFEFLGASPDARGQREYCVDRSFQGLNFDCSTPAGCDTPATVVLRGVEPPNFEGDPSEIVIVVEEIRPQSGLADSISIETDGEVTTLFRTAETSATCEFGRAELIGEDAGGGSNAEESGGIYESVSTTGGDIVGSEDSFVFQYAPLTGNFDVAIEILDSSHETGLGRWGKFGLMARQDSSECSRYSMLMDHLPNLSDPLRSATRSKHDTCDSYEETAGPGGGFTHPRFQRLVRKGTVIEGWVSNHGGLSNGTLDSCIDDHWTLVFSHDWGADSPTTLLVGFANSEHSSEGPAKQTVNYRILCQCSGN